jgi:hypothetical protein
MPFAVGRDCPSFDGIVAAFRRQAGMKDHTVAAPEIGGHQP